FWNSNSGLSLQEKDTRVGVSSRRTSGGDAGSEIARSCWMSVGDQSGPPLIPAPWNAAIKAAGFLNAIARNKGVLVGARGSAPATPRSTLVVGPSRHGTIAFDQLPDPIIERAPGLEAGLAEPLARDEVIPPVGIAPDRGKVDIEAGHMLSDASRQFG